MECISREQVDDFVQNEHHIQRVIDCLDIIGSGPCSHGAPGFRPGYIDIAGESFHHHSLPVVKFVLFFL